MSAVSVREEGRIEKEAHVLACMQIPYLMFAKDCVITEGTRLDGSKWFESLCSRLSYTTPNKQSQSYLNDIIIAHFKGNAANVDSAKELDGVETSSLLFGRAAPQVCVLSCC